MKLLYELVSANPHDTFADAAPWRGELGTWRCELDHGVLTATAEEFDSEAAARADLEPRLRAWEAVAYLRGQYEITFRPHGASDSPKAGVEHIFRRANEAYPAPDPTFTRTTLADQLLSINRRFADRRVDLPSAVRELLAAMHDAQPATGSSIAEAYSLDEEVVDTLSELAERGDADATSGVPQYRGPEWQWMQEALRRVTLQVGRRTASPPAERLSLADFRTRLQPPP